MEPRLSGVAGQREFLRSVARTAMLEYGLLPEFGPEVRAELSSLPSAAGRPARDLRDMAWCSLDNDDTRDFDQLSVSRPRTGGSISILVAVADVEERVHLAGAIDGHARHNTTTVYTPAEVFPMLPEELSTGLTSLVPGEDRNAIVCEIVVDELGALVDAEIFRAGCATARSWRTRARRPGWRAKARSPRHWPPCPGLLRCCRIRTKPHGECDGPASRAARSTSRPSKRSPCSTMGQWARSGPSATTARAISSKT